MTRIQRIETAKHIYRLASDICYELATGVHTHHYCNCGRGPTRAGLCWRCKAYQLNGLAYALNSDAIVSANKHKRFR